MDKDILAFVAHKWNCDYLQPMWHKGPCTCGLYDLFDKLLSVGLSINTRSIISLATLYQLYEIFPYLMASWENDHKNKVPAELFLCKKCGHYIAEKQPDIQGWDGYCHHCGMIAQSQVGVLMFSRLKK